MVCQEGEDRSIFLVISKSKPKIPLDNFMDKFISMTARVLGRIEKYKDTKAQRDIKGYRRQK